ncbi:putative transcription factor C2H2 family [Helianthus annuus]|uniref:Putative RING/U-box superfamily protein n=1 Tax=Helianthus annuus TaxID=4232 RepID=A0A251UR37_HELAN|nr:putative transcription factor C2H2 family [Helianthus annuus]KAJ0585686.1 putative transcription factor C2H2 family [Helianthus annuus]KAJ0920294.1 putative transcription factor C2H2 family [Helianthus annuus]KAJ0923923.1 putative transcription factor C2H2 family [Helianthus annuus]
MVYHSTANASISTFGSNMKEFVKKKRVNRTAKLKQCKLDVRREQWLSQVKKKGFKEENKGPDHPKMSDSDMHGLNKGENRWVVNSSGEENDSLINCYCDCESPSDSSVGHTSSLDSNMSVDSFTGSISSSSGDSGSCYSGSMTEEDDGDDGCLDDWETIADALAADEIKNDHNRNLETEMHEHSPQLEHVETSNDGQVDIRDSVNHQAWRSDDSFRPQGLPNLLKQNSFPMNLERSNGGTAWGFKNVGSLTPTACPICCEDLDLTDSSFLPCPCGYRLCLFCYKRILEDNGRCPGCRKEYEQFDQGNTTSKLARSYSMIPGH